MVQFDYPQTIEQAVERLVNHLSLSDRVFVANLGEDDLSMVHSLLAPIVRDELGVLSGNRTLIDACRLKTGNPNLSPEGAFSFLIQLFWKTLRKTHTLRIVRPETTKS
jgi:hypothetical protein